MRLLEEGSALISGYSKVVSNERVAREGSKLKLRKEKALIGVPMWVVKREHCDVCFPCCVFALVGFVDVLCGSENMALLR